MGGSQGGYHIYIYISVCVWANGSIRSAWSHSPVLQLTPFLLNCKITTCWISIQLPEATGKSFCQLKALNPRNQLSCFFPRLGAHNLSCIPLQLDRKNGHRISNGLPGFGPKPTSTPPFDSRLGEMNRPTCPVSIHRQMMNPWTTESPLRPRRDRRPVAPVADGRTGPSRDRTRSAGHRHWCPARRPLDKSCESVQVEILQVPKQRAAPGS